MPNKQTKEMYIQWRNWIRIQNLLRILMDISLYFSQHKVIALYLCVKYLDFKLVCRWEMKSELWLIINVLQFGCQAEIRFLDFTWNTEKKKFATFRGFFVVLIWWFELSFSKKKEAREIIASIDKVLPQNCHLLLEKFRNRFSFSNKLNR